MPLEFHIQRAARIIDAGGVVAYPTEGVFGLGCLPDDARAVARILQIKQRDPAQGLILIASERAQLARWVDSDHDLKSSAGHPVTWIVPATPAVPGWIRGRHDGVAVRVTSHPVAAALCAACSSALVSTSANVSGRPAARNRHILRRQFRNLVDFIVPGNCGPASGPSEIRDLRTGNILRPSNG